MPIAWNKGKKGLQVAWNKGIIGFGKGRIVSEETKQKMSISMTGKKHSEEYKKQRSELIKQKWSDPEYKKMIMNSRKGKMKPWNKGIHNDIQSGENHWNWKGGITKEVMTIRHSLEIKNWRIGVFERDNYTCQDCKKRGCILEAHHIKSFSMYPESRYDINNGITYCKRCHGKHDSERLRTLPKEFKEVIYL